MGFALIQMCIESAFPYEIGVRVQITFCLAGEKL